MQFGTALIPLTTDPFSNIFNIYNIYSYTEVIHFNQSSLMFVVLCEDQKLVYESFFTFALMWALGGAVADAWKLRNSEPKAASFATEICLICPRHSPDMSDMSDMY